MSESNKLEPAFPCPVGHVECYHPAGMTMLDYFAGQAIVGMVSGGLCCSPDGVAKEAYDLAIAMLAEKAKREGK